MVSRYRERRPKWSIAKIDAQTEQEDSFRRLIGLAKIAKRARINQMAKDSAKSLAPDIGNVPMINRETSDPPFKSIFTSTAGKIIPDYIERPVSDVARKTVGGAYNLVADVLPEHIFATASQATGLKFGEKTERVKRALDKFRDDTGVDLSYYYNLTSPGGVASNIAGMATGGPTPVDAFSPQQLKRLSELVTEVKDIRQERPWYAQVGMSVANPGEWVGGAAVGRGLASATARASTKTVAKTTAKKVTQKTTPEMPSIENMIDQLHPPHNSLLGGTWKKTGENFEIAVLNSAKLKEYRQKATDKLFEKLGGTMFANPSKLHHRFVEAMGLGDEYAKNNTYLLMRRMLNVGGGQGDANKLFNLNDQFVGKFALKTNPKKLEEVSFGQLAQYRNQFILTDTQKLWFKEFDDITQEMKRHIIDRGALRFKVARDATDKAEEKLRIKAEQELLQNKGVKGNYFPNIWTYWQYFDETAGEQVVKLPAGVKGAFGKKAPWEKARLHENAADAYEKGYRGDPMEQVRILWESMYQRVHEHQLTDYILPYMKTELDRIDPKYGKAVIQATKRATGLRQMKASVDEIFRTKSVMEVEKWPKTFRGLKSVRVNDADLEERFKKIGRKRKPETRQKAVQELQKELDSRIELASGHLKIVKTRKADMLKGAAKKPGEFSFPMTSLSGYIGTPKEIAKIIDDNIRVMVNDPLTNLDMKEWQMISTAIKKRTSSGNTFLRIAEGGQAASRALMTGLDLGVYMIHLLPMALTEGKLWGGVVKNSLRETFNPKGNALGRQIQDNWDTILEMARYNVLHGSAAEMVESVGKQGLLRKAAAGKPKILGGIQWGKPAEPILKGIERNFEGALTLSKIEMWKALKPMALRSGLPEDEALRHLASHVTKMTGTVSMAGLGIKPGTRQALGSLFMFAPRYRLSTYGLIKDVFKGNLEGDLARHTMGRMATSGLAYYMYLGHHLNQKPDLDPTSGNFLSYKIGSSRIGIGSSFYAMARFMGRIVGETVPDPEVKVVGKEIEQPKLFSPQRLKNLANPLKVWEHDNVMQKFLRSQIAPLTGTGWDLMEGRNYMGEPTTENWGQVANTVLTENLLPFWASGQIADQPRAGWQAVPSEMMGLRGYPKSTWERFQDHFDYHSVKETGKTWNEMTKLERAKIIKDNPQLQEIQNESWELSAVRERREEVAEYRTRLGEVERKYESNIQDAKNLFVNGNIRGKAFRTQRSMISFARREDYEEMDEKWGDVIEMLNEQALNPRSHLEDIAYYKYIETVASGDWYNEENGEYDYEGRKAAEQAFIDFWGADNFQYVKDRMDVDKDPLLKELDDGRDAIAVYWEVGKHILKRRGYGNLVPQYTEYLKERQYEREETEEEFPIFKEIYSAQSKARRYMRLDPEKGAKLEKWLYRWDYIDTLIHPENVVMDPELILTQEVIWE